MTEILDTNTMLPNAYEPKRSFEWILSIAGIDAFTAKTAARPKKTHGDITIDWINEKRFLAGKGEWQEISIVLYDPIAPSAAQKVKEWLRIVHDDATGRMGYAAEYKKDFYLKLLGPKGEVVEKWRCKGGWPKEVDWGTLDYSSDDALTVSFNIRADKWFLEF